MNRLFRSSTPGTAGYVALALFVCAYLGMLTLVVAPRTLLLPAPVATAPAR